MVGMGSCPVYYSYTTSIPGSCSISAVNTTQYCLRHDIEQDPGVEVDSWVPNKRPSRIINYRVPNKRGEVLLIFGNVKIASAFASLYLLSSMPSLSLAFEKTF